LNNTPNSNRIHIGIYGKRNAGKSSLLNAIVGQETSLVSNVKGTTTDPVNKPMELIPIGPVLFIDTAGLDDEGELGNLRVEKSLKVIQKTELALYLMDINDLDQEIYKNTLQYFKRFNIPYITVINKADTVSEEKINELKKIYKDSIFISTNNEKDIELLKQSLIKKIQNNLEKETPLVGDLVPYNGKVILVVPIDSEAPKGRIILPQVQVIRDCLDNGIKSYVVRDTELESAIEDLKDTDLVVTDSQAFKKVSEIVPDNIKLTSFSILFSRTKGELLEFVKGVSTVENLRDGAKILIGESCTHNSTHEDIGRVKIPNLMEKFTGKKFDFQFKTGHDFPEDLGGYDLVIHCGACMVNKKTVESRIRICREQNIPITNYGILLAFLTGILDRSIEIFNVK